MNIVELKDHNLRIGSREGPLGNSPGFASIADDNPVFGDEAFRKIRLHPQQSFDQFWSSLSLEPLLQENRHFRHQADIAYAHLDDLSRSHGLNDKLLIAVPSHYSSRQLATLLGIARPLPFEVTGLVDLPLLTMAGAGEDFERAVYMDIQLHQSVLTTFAVEDGQLVRDKVLQIPGSGLLALYDTWANLIAEAFIRQSRFNPQHNAETEQYIFNMLGQWLREVTTRREIPLEINNKGTTYQANLMLSSFEQRGRNIFTRIRQECDAVAAPGAPVFTTAAMAELPGFAATFPDAVVIAEEAALEGWLRHGKHLQSDPDAVRLVTRLPATTTAPKKTAAASDDTPSHVLFRHRAYPLPAQGLVLGAPGGGNSNGLPGLTLEDAGLSTAITISRRDGGYVLEETPEPELQLNGKPLTGSARIRLGDRLSLGDSGDAIEFIRVQ